jgi:CheY-like chemotaxis protein
MRRKSGISSTQTTPNSEDLLTFDTEERFQNSEEPVVFKMPTMSQTSSSSESFHPPQSPTSPYTRRNPPRSVAIPPAMKDLHHRPKETLPPKTTKDPSKPRPPNVLIVEDNSVNSLILATFLRKRGYPFIQAENGLLAVQAVQARPEGFDVILMDIQSTPPFAKTSLTCKVPVMDGSAATAAIRSLEKARSCRPSYIVALTGLAAEKDRQLAFASGVDHFLTKPVSLKQLGVVIDDWERRDVERGSMKSDFLQNSMEIRG